jgi:hypothetical protein
MLRISAISLMDRPSTTKSQRASRKVGDRSCMRSRTSRFSMASSASALRPGSMTDSRLMFWFFMGRRSVRARVRTVPYTKAVGCSGGISRCIRITKASWAMSSG